MKVHFRASPWPSDEKAYVIEIHDDEAKRSIGIAVGQGKRWAAKVVGARRWTPAFPSRASLATALLMARGEHRWWGRQLHVPCCGPLASRTRRFVTDDW